MHLYLLSYFSAAYSEGTYSTGTYNQAGTNTGALTNTGFDILLVATVACVIIFAALAIRLWKKGKKQ